MVIKQFKLLLHALVNNTMGIRMLVVLSDSESWILNLWSQSRSDGGSEIIISNSMCPARRATLRSISCKDILKDLWLCCKICLPSPTDRLFSCSRKCQSCLKMKRSWPLGTSSQREETDLQLCGVEVSNAVFLTWKVLNEVRFIRAQQTDAAQSVGELWLAVDAPVTSYYSLASLIKCRHSSQQVQTVLSGSLQ